MTRFDKCLLGCAASCAPFVVPPHVTAFGEKRGLDHLGGHPRVGARRRHFRGFVPLPRQAEVRDLQGLPSDVVVLDRFK